MSIPKIRKRLRAIESRLHGPVPTVRELKDLIVCASGEVLEEVIAELLRISPPTTESDSARIRCPQCGYAGPHSETPIPSAAVPSIKSTSVFREVTTWELKNAIERSSPDALGDAIALAFRELDASKELTRIQCHKCGHSVLSLAESESDSGGPPPVPAFFLLSFRYW
jgi:DNA-directed RNA polymerase subunit RPC12/RpoP